MLLAKTWTGQDPSGWWMSEKFDGVRAFWDGAALRTRTWAAIPAPARLTDGLPRGLALDGELWAGRGNFERVKGLVQSTRERAADWRGVHYMIFDQPTTDDVPVETRWGFLSGLDLGAHARIVAQTRCRGLDHLAAEFSRVIAAGGEGLVLREAGSCYDFERSGTALKVKPRNFRQFARIAA